ncbi:MAG: hypothetical protein M3Z21_09710 [Pseudomonadota bacterium]|nr:hypothetical protein [Pseudomonadota bacterium]
MHLLATLPQTRVELTFDRDLDGPPHLRARQLRGSLARLFAADDAFHQHDSSGRHLYRYPAIHYRWRGGRGLVVGWRESAQRVLQLPWLDLPLRLGDEAVRVTDALLVSDNSVFGVSDRLCHYRLVSPVLLLNQDNYRRYQTLDAAGQRGERDRLLVAQLLMTLRGLQVDFPCQLYAALVQPAAQGCFYKQQTLLGFKGGIVCNAVLPDGLAIGHAASHGYGWLEADGPLPDEARP